MSTGMIFIEAPWDGIECIQRICLGPLDGIVTTLSRKIIVWFLEDTH